MPKVKLIKVYAPYCDYCDNSIVSKDITEWDNVTDKELKLLKDFVKTKNDKYESCDSDEKYILVNYQNLEMSPQSTISQYLNEIEKEKEKQKKIKEDVNKRKKTAAHKKMIKEKKMLMELQKKYD